MKALKYLLMATMLIATVASAGMVQFNDDDPEQYLTFAHYNWDTTTVDAICSVSVLTSVDLDSGFVNFGAFTAEDTFYTTVIGYISPHYDENNNLIPGHYEGGYWLYEIMHYCSGLQMRCPDTLAVWVSYDIDPPSNCGNGFNLD